MQDRTWRRHQRLHQLGIRSISAVTLITLTKAFKQMFVYACFNLIPIYYFIVLS